MKIVCLVMIWFLASEVMGQQCIDHPPFGSRTTETRSISRIELSDTATVLFVDARYRPNWWIMVESGEYITPAEGGEKLKIVRSEGISLDKRFFMPASGEHSFKLFFPPLPEGVTHLDWHMGENQGIFDVALGKETGKELFPAALKGNWLREDGSWAFSFEDHFAVADHDFWEYEEVKTRGNRVEFHLKKEGGRKTIYAHIGKDGKVSLGDHKKSLRVYSRKSPERLVFDEENGFNGAILKHGTAVLKGFIKGYSPKMGKQRAEVYVDDALSGEQKSLELTIEEDGRFELTTEMDYPQPIYLLFPYRMRITVFLGPGDTTLMCLDMAQYIDPWRETEDISEREKTSLFAGGFARVNQDLQQCGHFLQLDYSRFQKEVKKYSPEEFKQKIKACKETAFRALEKHRHQKGLSRGGEQVLNWIFNLNCCGLLMEYNSFEASNWREENAKKKPEDQLPLKKTELDSAYYDLVRELSLEGEAPLLAGGPYVTLLNRIEFSDPYRKWLKGDIEGLDMETELQNEGITLEEREKELFAYMRKFQQMKEPDTALMRRVEQEYGEVAKEVSTKYSAALQKIVMRYIEQGQKETLRQYFGITTSFIPEIFKLQDEIRLLEQQFEVMSDSQLESLRKNYTNLFLYDYLVRWNDGIRNRLEANKQKTGFIVHPVPEVADSILLETLLREYDGKVVFLDFWATWCQPCRMGIEKMKPIKEKMADEDIVFVYITDETSPQKTYENMIPDIQGHHYRLSNRQFKYLAKKFQITGIPRYMVIGRHGEIVEPDFNGWLDARAIQKELQKYLK